MKLGRERKEINGVLAMIFSAKLLMLLVYSYFSKLLFTVLQWIFGDGAVGAYNLFADAGSLPAVLTEIFVYILCTFVPFSVYMFFSRKRSSEVILTKKPELMQVCFGVGASIIFGQIASIVGNVLIENIFRLFGNDGYLDKFTNESAMEYPNNFWIILLFLIMISVLPAFFEEFLIRGALVSATKKYGTLFTVFASAFFFAFLHNTWSQLPLAFTIGILSAYFTLRFQTIWIAVIAHFAFNFNSAVSGLLISMGGDGGMTALSVWYAIIYPLMIGFLIAGWIIYGFKKPEIPKSAYKNSEKWKLLLSSPFFYAFLILTVYRLISA